MCDVKEISEAFYEGDKYEEFEQAVKASMESIYGESPLFKTDAEGLFDLYLANLPEDKRQHYNCHACKHFIERYGGLVTITHQGAALPVMWTGTFPPLFRAAVQAICDQIGQAKVTGVFLSKDKILGTPVTGEWTHLHAENPKPFQERLHKAGEVMAEKRSDFILLKQSLLEYPPEVVTQATNLLSAEALYRSEKVLGVAKWLVGVHMAWQSQPNKKLADNVLWRAVAQAPPGYCHVKNTMIGTLLDDIIAGLSVEDVMRRFAAKMHPLQYQRPQAAPTAGNIARAEEIVAKLGIEKSLVRRFARLDEIQTLWRPEEAQPEPEKPGVFSHITPKGETLHKELEAPEQPITWRKFLETVLPNAKSIELLAPTIGNYTAILTAEHLDAPPIIQWDSPEKRNPFSSYVYNYGSPATRWGISPGWNKVTAICNHPSMWQEGFDHHQKRLVFILEGARDSNYQRSGNALFPEILKADLRKIRSTIEAYSRKAEILGYDQASACGIMFSGQSGAAVELRVTTDLGIARYLLDRWD